MLRPDEGLKPFVQAYYRVGGLAEDSMVGGPGLSVDLWWLEGPHLRTAQPGEKESRHTGAVIGGALTRMLTVKRGRGSEGFGVSLAPGVAPALFGVSAAELRDRFLPLGELLGAEGKTVVGRVLEAKGPFAKARALEGEIRRLLARRPAVEPRVGAMIARLEGSLERATAASMAGELNLTRRRLQDLVKESLGVSPKELIRVMRFRKALKTIADGRDWLDVVHDCGYVDQSHLIRHFRDFTGRTPSEFAAGGRLPPLDHQVPTA